MTNMRDWLEEIAAKNGNRIACMFEDTTISYEELDSNINRVANLLDRLGVKKGDKVSVLLGNCLEYIYVWFALAKLGAVTACVNTTFRGEGLQFLIESSDSQLAVVDRELADVYRPIHPELKKIRTTIWIPEAPDKGNLEADVSYQELFSSSTTLSPPIVELRASDPCGLVHTAGTTGKPKWCILSHGYYLEQGRMFADAFGYCPQDRVFDPLSLYHANPQVYLVMGTLSSNATMVMAKRFSVSAFWDQVHKYGVTIVILHHAPLEFLLKMDPRPDERDHALRFIFPANREVMERFDIKVSGQLFGMTEAASVTFQKFHLPLTGKQASLERLRSLCGKPSSSIEVAILDEDDRVLGPEKIGEIALRPKKANAIFSGYYGRPQETMECWRNLWFHTGDLGFFDEDGDLHFARRAAESIRIKGEWIDILGLEHLIRSYPKIHDVAVVGVLDPEMGKQVKACIEPVEGMKIDPAEIISYCEGRIAHFMIPRYIEILARLPRLGGTEKVAKSELEKSSISHNTWDRDKAGYKVRRI